MNYETLIIDAERSGLKIKEKKLKYGLKGLYKNGKIIIDSAIDTDNEKKCILMEELGHHYTSYGNIIDTTDIVNNKQENIARNWAYTKLVKITDIIKSYQEGIKGKYELAEFLNITEEFLEEAIDYYDKKYHYYEIDTYIICFNPLGIIEKFENF